jgi:CBS domain-containing protein
MELIITGVSAPKTLSPARATVTQHDHVAAAAYLMKHTGTTALIVTNAQTGQPAGIITDADIARAINPWERPQRRPGPGRDEHLPGHHHNHPRRDHHRDGQVLPGHWHLACPRCQIGIVLTCLRREGPG